jgi:hypothetical protein
MFATFLSDRGSDIPNQWVYSLEFDDQITCCVFSFHGFMLAVGYFDGRVVVCDSETGSNRLTLSTLSSPVASLSFSRHGHNLVFGSASGLVEVRRILTSAIVYSSTFRSGIVDVEFSPHSLPFLLVLESSQLLTIVHIENREKVRLPGEFVSACWSRELLANGRPPTIIAATLKTILLINSVTLEILWRHEVATDRKGIAQIVPSHRGDSLLVLEKGGAALLVSIEAQMALTNFHDPTNDKKFTCGCFDADDQHVILSSNQTASCLVIIFSVRDGGLITSVLQGPSEAVHQILFHPLWPHVYTRAAAGIRVWTPTYLNSWSTFVPGFDHVMVNLLYDERESEFDEEEAVNESAGMNRPERIDLFGNVPDFIFPSDAQFEDQLLYVPFDEDAAILARIREDEAEAESQADDGIDSLVLERETGN